MNRTILKSIFFIVSLTIFCRLGLAEKIIIDYQTQQPFSRGVRGKQNVSFMTEGPLLDNQSQAAFKSCIRGVATGFSATTYNWKNRTGVAYAYDGYGRSALQFLREVRDAQAIPVITVNIDAIGTGRESNWIATNSSIPTLAQLAADWVYYTQNILPAYRQGDTITDPTAIRILSEITWSDYYRFYDDKLLAPDENSVSADIYWEIGNEPEYRDYPGGIEEYNQRYQTISEAMLAVDPNIKVGPCVGHFEEITGLPFVDSLLNDTNMQIDFISIHPYGGLNKTDNIITLENDLNNLRNSRLSQIDLVRDHISSSGRNPNLIKIMCSEWNPSYDSWRTVYEQRMAFALATTETIFILAEKEAFAAHFHSPLTKFYQSKLPYFKSHLLLAEYMGDSFLDTFIESNIRIYVTQDSETRNIAVWGMNFLNTNDTVKNLSIINLPEDFQIKKITKYVLGNIIGNTDLLSYNDAEVENIDWASEDKTGLIDISDFYLNLNHSETTVLVIEPKALYCGDTGTDYLESDVNKDCKVNFEDFCLVALDWITRN